MSSDSTSPDWVYDGAPPRDPSYDAIARRAGVARSTVSRAMRGDPRITAETTRRVRAAAEALGYRPNPLISALMERIRSKCAISFQGTIAIITDHPDAARWHHPWHSWSELHRGAVERAQERGYQIECISTHGLPADGRRLTEILRARGIHGIYVTPRFTDRHLRLGWEGFSAATTGRSLLEPQLHRVAYDSFHGVQLACRKLRAAGCRRIMLYLRQREDLMTDRNYVAGFLLFLESIPPEERIPPCLVAEYSRESFLALAREFRPDGVACHAEQVLGWAEEAGLGGAEGMSFVHLDHVPALTHCAGVNHNNHLIGRVAIDLIIAQIHRAERGAPAHPLTTVVDGHWVDGPSLRHRTPGAPAEAAVG
jgi:DNA-binding LacI/PurR family transcriptional regulator